MCGLNYLKILNFYANLPQISKQIEHIYKYSFWWLKLDGNLKSSFSERNFKGGIVQALPGSFYETWLDWRGNNDPEQCQPLYVVGSCRAQLLSSALRMAVLKFCLILHCLPLSVFQSEARTCFQSHLALGSHWWLAVPHRQSSVIC